jgi:predicted HTH domain antitoxin
VDELNTVSIRLEETQDKEVEAFAKRLNIDKSSAARKIIDEGLKIVKTKEALDNIRLKRWTIWKAAQYCGESYRSFLDLLRHENIPFPLSVEDLELEIYEGSSQ